MNVGSLEPRKNQIELLDLFKVVRQEHANSKLVLVGDGAQRDAIEQKIRSLQLGSSVILLGHRTDVPARAVVAEYVDIANAFVDREETGMVNAVLDQLARKLRPSEFQKVE